MNPSTIDVLSSNTFHDKLKIGIISGSHKGWKGFVWMIKILVPISFLTMLIDYFGIIKYFSIILQPVLSLLQLPPVAVLPMIIGMLTGIYGGIASMVMLPLTIQQMTLIGVFILISHNLIQECVIQKQSGMNVILIVFIRLIASCVTVMAIAPFLQSESMASSQSILPNSTLPLSTMVVNWANQTIRLSVKIFIIIMVIMMSLGILKSFDLIQYIVKGLSPILKLLGLSEKSGILWMTAVVFGLAYGAAVIVEEAKEGKLTPDELTQLHISIGINHSMVEDPLLLASIGLPAFWLWVPRLITAIGAVYLYKGWIHIRPTRQ